MVARELKRYNIDIAALSETRFAEKGQLSEAGGGYTFFWSGRPSTERREAGVGFAVRNHLVRHLVKLPDGINDRLMTLQAPLAKGKTATLISAYAPTMTNPDDIKDKFYEELDATIARVPKTDKLILLGDFNARVGTDHQTWDGVIGTQGVGKSNSNGILLLKTCAAHELIITNTLFRLPNRNKTTWMHPRSKHWHLIDYIIVRKKDRQDVRVTKAMRGAECWTDHRLIVSKLDIHIQPKRRPQGAKTVKKLNVTKLENKETAENLSKCLDNRLTESATNVSTLDQRWETFRNVIYSTAHEHLGLPTRRHQDWFDENDPEINALLTEKYQLLRAHQNDPGSGAKKAAFTSKRNQVQRKLRVLQDTWLAGKAKEIQLYADSHDSKRFYNALKSLYGPQPSGTSPLFNTDGSQLLTEKQDILNRWAEHFNNVLNRPSTINDDAIDRLPQVETNHDLDQLPTQEEIEKAIKLMSSGKAPGADAIPSEIYKIGGPAFLRELTSLFQAMWKEGKLPQDFRDATVVHIYKRKGNRQLCDNHRGISLLSIAGKILARVLLNRLLQHLEKDLLPESQCGFRAGRGTVDMIFAVRQMQEKCQEQNISLYTTFIDLTKAFDTVSRNGLWKIMAKFGCPGKFIEIVRQFHDGMMVRVLDDGDMSEAFEVTNGVKQGCVLAPTLFSMMFSAMLLDAFQDKPDGISITYRTDGKLFNTRRLQATTKVRKTVVRDFLFADDCALSATSEELMQLEMDRFASACNNYGLTISTKKTEVMYQPAPGKPPIQPKISVNAQDLKSVDNFTYLGSTLTTSANIDSEINNRTAKASAAFGRLRSNVWERRGISLTTKLKVYQAVVLTALLYACETWTVYRRHAKQLNHFHLSCLRKILRIRWQDKIPDTEVLKKASSPSIYTLLLKAQVRWAGHVVRMDDSRLPKQMLYGELATGKRNVGRPKKRYKDSLKTSLKELNINTTTWESQASDRSAWRTSITKGAKTAETKRIKEAKEKREARKARNSSHSQQATASSLTCNFCGRDFRARIGLFSHLRTHQRDDGNK